MKDSKQRTWKPLFKYKALSKALHYLGAFGKPTTKATAVGTVGATRVSPVAGWRLLGGSPSKVSGWHVVVDGPGEVGRGGGGVLLG